MKSQSVFFCTVLAFAVAAFMAFPGRIGAQSLTTGDVSGTVLDPSGAAIPNATVTITNDGTGAKSTVTSNSTGAYRFGFLNPGNYMVSVAAPGFQTVQQAAVVSVGQASTLNMQLQVATSSQTVEVSGAGVAIHTENGNVSTTIAPETVANMPNPGNDLSYYVQVAPGATMNTQGGYGNTVLYGISGTSNLFTVDGMDENDPFLNLNNSGATNLLLGSNDIQTASIVNNGYEGEYGTLAGSNVNYVTKSGTNKFHGNAEYFWNGRVLNANDWFNNNTGTPRPFDNANQWAASFGGPIVKDKTFFFVNTEGLRLLIPTAVPVNIPSPQFQAATLTSVPASEVPFYTRIFNIYNSASGATRAANILPGGGCDGSVTLAGGAPCALEFQSNIDNLTDEWLMTARVDQNISSTDHAFLHFRTDHGLQATYTDPLDRSLNAQSIQPQYEGQFQETHQVGANAINQFILAGSWYSAVFGPPNIATATTLMPYQLTFGGSQFYTPGGPNYTLWPQGRNVTQYQISDDYSWQKGAHNLKFGVGFRRNDISDYTPETGAVIPSAIFSTEASFMAGSADTYTQSFASRPTEPLALYTLGLYAQDEWSVRHNLKVNLSLRAEHNSNPICITNCFARLNDSFATISHDITQPYNQAIRTGLHQSLPSLQAISWEPRLGFAWQPLDNGKTVVRGGVGLFSDIFPGTIATSFDTNSPLKNSFVIPGGIGSGVPIAPGVAGNAQSLATTSNTAFVSGFKAGLNFPTISTLVPTFSPPTMVNSARNIRYPSYQEWNLEVEQALSHKMSFSVNYVGNHGSDLAAGIPEMNAFCGTACLSALATAKGLATAPTTFLGLPASVPDGRFSTVTEIGNYGVSNYNGVTVALQRQMSTALQVQASFTWSHALDDISNGGFLPFGDDTDVSVIAPQNPSNFKQYNYGNADYDARKQANLSYVYTTPKLHSFLANTLLGWTVAGTLFVRTGLPFTAYDGAATAALEGFNYGPDPLFPQNPKLFANQLVGPLNCNSSAAYTVSGTNTPCMTPAEFTSSIGPVAALGAERRNQIYGPDFFDTDLSLMKNFRVPHWESAEFQIGAQAFNILNHPNFDQPVADIPNPQFGSSIRTVETPTSIFGSFLNANAAPRALQIRAQLQF